MSQGAVECEVLGPLQDPRLPHLRDRAAPLGLRSRPATRPRPPEDPELESCVGDTLSYVTGTRGATRHDDGVDTAG
jgi:hypothetical protein